MNNKILKISASIIVLFLMINCANYKAKRLLKEGITAENAIKYKSKNKSKRNTFFKTTDSESIWVDNIYSKMTLEEKIGQLFMISAYSNKDESHQEAVEKLVTENHVGGIIFFQGGPVRQANLTNRYQAKAKVPLFIAIDGEWGLSMRLDSTYRYPWNMTLGAIQDLKLVEKVGQNMGEENKRMGIHFNFAPVIDINTNPKNPIIGNRSFGESKINVANKATALMKGQQSQGVFSTGKHFPGHGDTSTDSHKTLPTVGFSKRRINLVELYPYKQLFDEGLASVMVGHLNIPSLESSNRPTSLSYKVVTKLLQKKMNFKGLILTDALGMKGASNFIGPGEIDLEAFLAGNDILLCPENVPLAIAKIKAAYNDNRINENRLAYSVKKILHYKYKSGLNNYKPINTTHLQEDLNSSKKDALHYQLYENAITVLQNKESILPIKDLSQKIAYVKLGDSNNSSFLTTLKKYTEVIEVSDTNIDRLNDKLKDYSTVIIGFHKLDKAWENQEFSETELNWLEQIASKNKVILDVFTKPYTLLTVPTFENIEGVVVSYQNSDIAQVVSAELLFGAIEAKGKTPVSINNHFSVNDGLATEKLNRLGFTAAENMNMDPAILNKIDAIAQKAIDGKMAPGMQVLVARKGKVVFQKSYGHPTYDTTTKVTNTDLYDVASLSKMISTLPNIMQLFDQKKVALDTRLGTMLPYFANTNKKDILFKNLLSHYAGLKSWIPFYKETLDATNKPSETYYRKVPNPKFSIKVADSLYLRTDYQNTIMKIIADSPLATKKEYVYSDFTFILLKEYLEQITHKKLDILSQENFFNSLGMNYTLYNPLQKFDKNVIAPSEVDTYFRHQQIQGYVHDMAAAMQGGVAGHAGIFSNAMDVAKMMQLYLQKGSYGNHRYFSEETFDAFNTCYFCSEGVERGLGFDKRLGANGPTCQCASPSSFGHTGFTGDMAWADPENEIVYIFLSNRTYPEVSAAGNTLAKEKIREDIQKIIYEAIQK
ncbi:glycoside hydrolase family 3 N-terminal domain-containing protein [Flavobacterium sp. Arc3]|jgi:beta-glucosidase-like glycosyl hydrolase/CubicO group peptidase (beta-lactamase class C family)|uniref:glycoside hydrolase family 3 N-terminal domain-containing protein n=1 Tax=unclassified Flavobacterium TaxID=196869 RepID=UPI00352E147C